MIFKKTCLYCKKITNNTAPHDQDGQFTLQWVDIKAVLHFKCLFTYEIGQNGSGLKWTVPVG